MRRTLRIDLPESVLFAKTSLLPLVLNELKNTQSNIRQTNTYIRHSYSKPKTCRLIIFSTLSLTLTYDRVCDWLICLFDFINIVSNCSPVIQEGKFTYLQSIVGQILNFAMHMKLLVRINLIDITDRIIVSLWLALAYTVQTQNPTIL